MVNVRKYKNLFFFIKGNEGVEYFCHKNNLVNKNDWKYCYNKNTCEFDIDDTENKKHLSAINVKPRHKLNKSKNCLNNNFYYIVQVKVGDNWVNHEPCIMDNDYKALEDIIENMNIECRIKKVNSIKGE